MLLGIGVSVQCHHNYIPEPAAHVYCSWFFGPEGFIDILPAYYKDLTSPKHQKNKGLFGSVNSDQSFAFVRNMTGINCVKKIERVDNCEKNDVCSVKLLTTSNIDHGHWICMNQTCALHCEVHIKEGSQNSMGKIA